MSPKLVNLSKPLVTHSNILDIEREIILLHKPIKQVLLYNLVGFYALFKNLIIVKKQKTLLNKQSSHLTQYCVSDHPDSKFFHLTDLSHCGYTDRHQS